MEFSKRRIIKFIVVLVFLVCTFFANTYAIRKLSRYAVEIYFYDKLLVAYNIGAEKGLEEELAKIRVTDKMPQETVLAKEFAVQLKSLKDPAEFLGDKVEQGKKKANFIRDLRSIAIILMAIIFCWRSIINFIANRKSKKSL
jgi:hypothetical protein